MARRSFLEKLKLVSSGGRGEIWARSRRPRRGVLRKKRGEEIASDILGGGFLRIGARRLRPPQDPLRATADWWLAAGLIVTHFSAFQLTSHILQIGPYPCMTLV